VSLPASDAQIGLYDEAGTAGSMRPAARWVLRDTVYESILAMLLEQHLPPGAPLRIETIARDLAVSPTPVREALVQIENTGLITRTALKGYRVAAPLSKEDQAKLMAVRLLLEPKAARAAFETHGEDLAIPLGKVLARQRAAAGSGQESEIREYLRADIEFHNVVLDNCANPFLRRAVQSLGAQFHRYHELSQPGGYDADQAIAEHQHVVDAFVCGSADMAAAAMEDHLNAVLERIQRQ